MPSIPEELILGLFEGAKFLHFVGQNFGPNWEIPLSHKLKATLPELFFLLSMMIFKNSVTFPW